MKLPKVQPQSGILTFSSCRAPTQPSRTGPQQQCNSCRWIMHKQQQLKQCAKHARNGLQHALFCSNLVSKRRHNKARGMLACWHTFSPCTRMPAQSHGPALLVVVHAKLHSKSQHVINELGWLESIGRPTGCIPHNGCAMCAMLCCAVCVVLAQVSKRSGPVGVLGSGHAQQFCPAQCIIQQTPLVGASRPWETCITVHHPHHHIHHS